MSPSTTSLLGLDLGGRVAVARMLRAVVKSTSFKLTGLCPGRRSKPYDPMDSLPLSVLGVGQGVSIVADRLAVGGLLRRRSQRRCRQGESTQLSVELSEAVSVSVDDVAVDEVCAQVNVEPPLEMMPLVNVWLPVTVKYGRDVAGCHCRFGGRVGLTIELPFVAVGVDVRLTVGFGPLVRAHAWSLTA